MIATELNHEQRSPEWFAARVGRVTASQFNAVQFGGSGAETIKAEVALERIKGEQKETYQSAAMQNGTETEELARLRYELKTGYDVRECGFFAHNTLLAGASPDGLVNDDGLVEIKCPVEKTHLQTMHTGKIPNQYYWQMVGQMWMTGRKWCDYVSFHPDFPPNAQLLIKRVERNESDIIELDSKIRKFLVEVDREVEFIRQYNGKPNEVTVTRIKK